MGDPGEMRFRANSAVDAQQLSVEDGDGVLPRRVHHDPFYLVGRVAEAYRRTRSRVVAGVEPNSKPMTA